jgi:hypothetical protein
MLGKAVSIPKSNKISCCVNRYVVQEVSASGMDFIIRKFKISIKYVQYLLNLTSLLILTSSVYTALSIS